MTVAAPRSGGGAVQRNRGRRRVREAFRTVIRDLPDGAGSDLVVVAHPAVASAPYAELRAAAAATLATLATHGGT